MKSVGIIAEFNPFHAGHSFLVEKARKLSEDGILIAVMSGDFTQRGEPAAFDKWQRAECAVKNGINLVVELPVVFACNSAEFFAKGGVEILEGFGCVDKIVFGSESGNIDELSFIAEQINKYEAEINREAVLSLKTGVNYPKAREKVMEKYLRGIDIKSISEPNNILAIEYLRKIKNLKPITIKRKGDSHHISGTLEREKLRNLYPGKYENIDKKYFDLVTSKVLTSDVTYLERIFTSDLGLAGRLKKYIRYSSDVNDLIEKIKTKAYTRTRVSRLLSQMILNIDKGVLQNTTNYIRILAFDSKGASFLKRVKKEESNTLPIITNINRELDELPEVLPLIEKDILASDIYNLLTMNDLYSCSDYIKKPFIGL